MNFMFEKQPQLLLTYSPHWNVQIKDDNDQVAVRSVLDYLVDATEKKLERQALQHDIEMHTELAYEIVMEIIDYVVASADIKVKPQPQTLTAATPSPQPPEELQIDHILVTNDVLRKELSAEPMELSSDSPRRNLQEELSDDYTKPSMDSDPLNESAAEFEELWIKKKCDVEKCAESRAKAQFRQWQRDRTTLAQAIDESLKEYAEMYEKAHALRLMFEEEKSQWSRKIMQVHAEDTPYGDLKRRRCDTEWAPPQPAWPYPQRQSLDHEFQYTVDESQDQNFGPERDEVSCGMGLDNSCSNMISPNRRQAKKFTVPMKHVSEE